MFVGKNRAIIAGKEREIELISTQLAEAKRELLHVREQLDRVYSAVLGLHTDKLKRPLQGKEMRDELGR